MTDDEAREERIAAARQRNADRQARQDDAYWKTRENFVRRQAIEEAQPRGDRRA